MIEQRYRKFIIAVTCEHMADSLRLNNFELRRQFAEESDTLIRHDVAIFRSDHDDWSCNAGRCRLYRLAFGGWVEEFGGDRSEEHTSELQSLMRISYAVFCLKKKKNRTSTQTSKINITSKEKQLATT